jgi:FkbM family methyltransferase
MKSNTTLTLVDGVRIIVPDSLNLITTYVLREQEDWFEDEIKFLRHLLQSGQRVIDVGANYGVYTLSMAKLVGSTGRVWAFEPASMTAGLLSSSIAANDFDQVILEQKALSNMSGTAQLSLNDNSELNSLVRDSESIDDETETVSLVTLDECLEENDWQDIEFLKLDAEGEEANILRGGARFFATQSPLVQYEIRAGTELHLELVQAFVELGYSSYRLVPGLNLLAPFNEKEPVDGYLLNLFCCKPDRAVQLAAKGFLVEGSVDTRKEDTQTNTPCGTQDSDQANNWLVTLTKLPYGQMCADHWRKMMTTGQCGEVEAALSCYARSRSPSMTAVERLSALEESFVRLKDLCETQPTYLRLASLARVAREYGARLVAVKALNQLCKIIFQQRQINPSEPFLAPGERFDSVSPRNSLANWIAAAALEELERNGALSSFYSGASTRQQLEIIRDLGFGSDEMNRRLNLIELRFDTSDI